MNDPFEDIRKQEKASIEEVDQAIESREQWATEMKRISGLRHQAGYKEFYARLVHLTAVASTKLANSKETNEVFNLQGQFWAYNEIAKLLERTDGQIQAIDKELSGLRKLREESVVSGGKVKTQGVVPTDVSQK